MNKNIVIPAPGILLLVASQLSLIACTFRRSIGIGTAHPNSSSLVDITSNSKELKRWLLKRIEILETLLNKK